MRSTAFISMRAISFEVVRRELPVNFTQNDVQRSDDRHQVGNH